jgi:PAS domain S-box-containing protein
MELDFRKNPAILSNMLDVMADGVFTVDANGHIVAWSSGAARITGYSGDDVIGHSCHILEGQNCKGFQVLTDFLANPSPYPWGICNQECKVLGKDGRELYLFGNVSIIRDILNNQKIAVLEEQTKSREAFQQLIGKSPAMQEVFRRLRLAAQSDVTVLLTGESGTGKELAARAIHALSARKDNPFFAINCSAIPETLLESELFGHVKGAFTGAIRDKIGVFLQLKLLRVLQEGEIRRVGDDRAIKINVRLITATNRNLQTLMASGTLREDFYYRIHVFEITLPPLRERRADIQLLVNHFMEDNAKIFHREVNEVAQDALQRLQEYGWPGNVRELKNAIEHAFVTVADKCITLWDLPPAVQRPSLKTSSLSASSSSLDPAEEIRIREALQQAHGNKTEAAKLLGVSRVTLWKKLKFLDIKSPASA